MFVPLLRQLQLGLVLIQHLSLLQLKVVYIEKYYCFNQVGFLNADLESPKLFLPFIPLGVEYDSTTVFLPKSDDETSDAIFVPNSIDFPFGDSLQTHFFVSLS